jgi:hypothetical protein
MTTRAQRRRTSGITPSRQAYELGPKPDYREAIELLRSWREASDDELLERQETWEYLKKALDEDRLSSRKFFP